MAYYDPRTVLFGGYFWWFSEYLFEFVFLAIIIYLIMNIVSVSRKKTVKSLPLNLIVSLVLPFIYVFMDMARLLPMSLSLEHNFVSYSVNLLAFIPIQGVLFTIMFVLLTIQIFVSVRYLALKIEKKEKLFSKKRTWGYYLLIVSAIQIINIIITFASFHMIYYFFSISFFMLLYYLVSLALLVGAVYAGIDILKLKKR